MTYGLCPKCEDTIDRVDICEIQAATPFGAPWRTVTYQCSRCRTILGVQIDPIAIKTDIINSVTDAVLKLLRETGR